jgi:uncharacterized protein (TIGR02186 family)
MMSRLLRLLAFVSLASCLSAPALAEQLVSALSDEEVEIRSDFVGSRIVVFGAITKQGGISEDPNYEVAVVVEGPRTDVITRKKDRRLGIWVNANSRQFYNVPSYYAVHLSENYSAVASEEQLRQYRLGLHNLNFYRSAYENDDIAFADALIELRRNQGMFDELPDAIGFLAPNVFRTTFHLPSVVPVGTYRVSVYLFRDEELVAAQVQNLKVAKRGFSDQIATFADQQGLAYGLAVLVIAVVTGWLAGVAFRRN